MTKLLLTMLVALSTTVHAEAGDWADKIDDYKRQVKIAPNHLLWVHNLFYTSGAVATCSMSAAVVGATFVGDTVPVGNIVAETIANVANADYKTYDALMSWETLAQLMRGTAGGGAVALVESLEFVVQWLGGQEERSFKSLRENYASTFNTMDTVMSKEGQCVTNIMRVLMVRKEMQARRMFGFDQGQTHN